MGKSTDVCPQKYGCFALRSPMFLKPIRPDFELFSSKTRVFQRKSNLSLPLSEKQNTKNWHHNLAKHRKTAQFSLWKGRERLSKFLKVLASKRSVLNACFGGVSGIVCNFPNHVLRVFYRLPTSIHHLLPPLRSKFTFQAVRRPVRHRYAKDVVFFVVNRKLHKNTTADISVG